MNLVSLNFSEIDTTLFFIILQSHIYILAKLVEASLLSTYVCPCEKICILSRSLKEQKEF